MPISLPNGSTTLFAGPDAPNESDLYKCVHCGFCLQSCPTYITTGLETESPRGRIALMKAVNEGRIGITPNVIRHWNLCIQCRACEVACPSGVAYGRLIESTMNQIENLKREKPLPKLFAILSPLKLLNHPKALAFVVNLLRLYQQSGIQYILRKTLLLKLISKKVYELEHSLPRIPSEVFEAKHQVILPQGRKRGHVAILSGCIMPLVNGPQMNAMTRVLTRNGCEVKVPSGQGCCGAINTHSGDLTTAREMARRNIDIFLESDVDTIIVASAGCGTRMKEYDHLLRNDVEYAEKSKVFSKKVKDIHEYLVELPFNPPTAKLNYRVTYQDSCHLSNTQNVTQQPRYILKSIPGVEFVELSTASLCCGGGGTYTITERDFSLRVLDSKMESVKNTGADVVATANPGCLLQIQYGAKRENIDVKVVYVTDLLDEAYLLEDKH